MLVVMGLVSVIVDGGGWVENGMMMGASRIMALLLGTGKGTAR